MLFAERSSRLAASEPSSWRLSLSRSARFDTHDLRGKMAGATLLSFPIFANLCFYLYDNIIQVCMFARLVNVFLRLCCSFVNTAEAVSYTFSLLFISGNRC